MAQQDIIRLGLANSRELQGHFTTRIGKYRETRGK